MKTYDLLIAGKTRSIHFKKTNGQPSKTVLLH